LGKPVNTKQAHSPSFDLSSGKYRAIISTRAWHNHCCYSHQNFLKARSPSKGGAKALATGFR
ncbi:MAG TPA: hypothetical protein VGA27_10450, partial [Candidatus Binatia bacterium]